MIIMVLQRVLSTIFVGLLLLSSFFFVDVFISATAIQNSNITDRIAGSTFYYQQGEVTYTIDINIPDAGIKKGIKFEIEIEFTDIDQAYSDWRYIYDETDETMLFEFDLDNNIINGIANGQTYEFIPKITITPIYLSMIIEPAERQFTELDPQYIGSN